MTEIVNLIDWRLITKCSGLYLPSVISTVFSIYVNLLYAHKATRILLVVFFAVVSDVNIGCHAMLILPSNGSERETQKLSLHLKWDSITKMHFTEQISVTPLSILIWLAIKQIKCVHSTEPSCRRCGLGREALLTMMNYGTTKTMVKLSII